MEQPVMNAAADALQYTAEMGDKNDNLPDSFPGEKSATFVPSMEFQQEGQYIVQQTTEFLVTTESSVVTTEESVYTNAQNEFDPNTVSATQAEPYVPEQIASSEYIIDQENFVTQYIQEAQAGSQYQANEQEATETEAQTVELEQQTESVAEAETVPVLESEEQDSDQQVAELATSDPVSQPESEAIVNGANNEEAVDTTEAPQEEFVEQTVEANKSAEQETVNETEYMEDEQKSELETSKDSEVIELSADNLQNYEILSEYDGKMVHVHSDDQGQVLLIEYEDADEEAAEESDSLQVPLEQENVVVDQADKRSLRYGRRVKMPESTAVPAHVLGIDIQSNVDPLTNGKRPRLGVKIPSMNLQSQIISKEELQKEIMDRCKQNSGSNFAKTLTSRLAQKLSAGKVKEKAKTNKTESDNADLLAILEGNDTPEKPPKQVVKPAEVNEESEENIKMLEREIAMQQLQEFPMWSPKIKHYPKGTPQLTKPNIQAGIAKAKNKAAAATEVKPETESQEEATSVAEPVEAVPEVKVNKVLKTYSRKRKSTDSDSASEIVSPTKKTAVELKAEMREKLAAGGDYITKSSRIIKKKVIWDPDEAQPRLQQGKAKMEIKSIKLPEKKPETPKAPEKKPAVEVKAKIKEESKSVPPSPKKIKSPMQKKRLTEVDKLLMDEGAVNMLYDVKNTEESLEKRKKTVSTGAKANREIQKRANEIKNDLQHNTTVETPSKSLRKKEGSISSPSSIKTPVVADKKAKKDGKAVSPPGSPSFGETSQLIRRRSSSSISSASEIGSDDEARTSRSQKAKRAKKAKEPAEEAPKEEAKQPEPEPKANDKGKYSQYQSFTVKKTGKLMTIDLNYPSEQCQFSVDALKELVQVFKQLAKDKDCNVVSLTSGDVAFCLGLDYKYLIADTADARKKKAQELSNAVRDFLKCLLNFPKILIAGIQGDCSGLGVTMLPLFDLVVATEAATFSTPYSGLGAVAEAAFLLAPPFTYNRGLAAEMLYASNSIKADDAQKRGLISRVCWPEKYQEELKTLQTDIANGSRQSLEGTKKQVNAHLIKEAEAAIASQSSLLVEQWTSEECQKNFAALN